MLASLSLAPAAEFAGQDHPSELALHQHGERVRSGGARWFRETPLRRGRSRRAARRHPAARELCDFSMLRLDGGGCRLSTICNPCGVADRGERACAIAGDGTRAQARRPTLPAVRGRA